MLSKAYSSFMRQRSRMEVVRKMVEYGISVKEDGSLAIGDLRVQDTALAEAARVDRRVVRSTVKQILSNPELERIFRGVKPVGTSLVDIASLLGYSVLIISADPYKAGIISQVSAALASKGIVIRQALADEPDITTDPKLTLVVEGQVPGETISKIQSLDSVKGVALLK